MLAGISSGLNSPTSKNATKGSMMILVRSSSTSAVHVAGSSDIAFQKPRIQLRTSSCAGFCSPDRNRGR